MMNHMKKKLDAKVNKTSDKMEIYHHDNKN